MRLFGIEGGSGVVRPETARRRPGSAEGARVLGRDGRDGPARAHRGRHRRRSRQNKAAWYLPTALLVEALAVAVPVVLLLRTSGEAHPWGCAFVAAGVWLAVAAARGRYRRDQLGETRSAAPVLRDWLTLVGALAAGCLALDRPLPVTPAEALLILLPSPLVTVVYRKAVNRHLVASRRDAQAVRRVLLVGEARAVDEVVAHLARRTDHAFVVVGLCTLGSGRPECGAPVWAELPERPGHAPSADADAVVGAAEALDADLVFVAPGCRMFGDRLRRLAWALHDSGRALVVIPGVTEVARRRARLSIAAGLTLLHVAPPTRRGLPVALKAAADRVGALLLVVALAPLFAVLALAVRAGSPGPAFHRQIRVGQGGRPFRMWKFRTMVVDADRLKERLLASNENDGLMFKMRQDPRVTRVGRVLRRYSLDELPQLLNVLAGHMSLVGPRPPLPEEVAGYTETELRRLSVRPGLTGLWQVSGRSDLSWDETVALDLRYVDNWCLAWDADVMVRTLKAVVDGRGAY
ncbi:hypothetical protein GCM10027168_73850 [Streptomyces capparidis]